MLLCLAVVLGGSEWIPQEFCLAFLFSSTGLHTGSIGRKVPFCTRASHPASSALQQRCTTQILSSWLSDKGCIYVFESNHSEACVGLRPGALSNTASTTN